MHTQDLLSAGSRAHFALGISMFCTLLARAASSSTQLLGALGLAIFAAIIAVAAFRHRQDNALTVVGALAVAAGTIGMCTIPSRSGLVILFGGAVSYALGLALARGATIPLRIVAMCTAVLATLGLAVARDGDLLDAALAFLLVVGCFVATAILASLRLRDVDAAGYHDAADRQTIWD